MIYFLLSLQVESNFLSFGSRGVRNAEFKTPSGIATNNQGQIYVTDQSNHRIQLFDKFGAFLSEFGGKGSKQGQFLGPQGIAIDQSGMIFVADSDNHRIQVFNANGTYYTKFGSKGMLGMKLYFRPWCCLKTLFEIE